MAARREAQRRMGKARQRRTPPRLNQDVVTTLERVPAERELNALMPGTSRVKARQFTHIRNGLMVALLQDPRTRETLTRWRHEMTDGQAAAERIADEARAFVTGILGLPWLCFAYALLEEFWRSVETGDCDWSPVAYEVDLMAPPMSLYWRRKAGESIREASARLASLYKQAQQALKRAETEWRSGERMKSTAEALMRAGYLWYLVNVAKPPIPKAELARAVLQDSRAPRRTVQLEIAKAQRLLDEVPAAIFPAARQGANVRPAPPRP